MEEEEVSAGSHSAEDLLTRLDGLASPLSVLPTVTLETRIVRSLLVSEVTVPSERSCGTYRPFKVPEEFESLLDSSAPSSETGIDMRPQRRGSFRFGITGT